MNVQCVGCVTEHHPSVFNMVSDLRRNPADREKKPLSDRLMMRFIIDKEKMIVGSHSFC